MSARRKKKPSQINYHGRRTTTTAARRRVEKAVAAKKKQREARLAKERREIRKALRDVANGNLSEEAHRKAQKIINLAKAVNQAIIRVQIKKIQV